VVLVELAGCDGSADPDIAIDHVDSDVWKRGGWRPLQDLSGTGIEDPAMAWTDELHRILVVLNGTASVGAGR